MKEKSEKNKKRREIERKKRKDALKLKAEEKRLRVEAREKEFADLNRNKTSEEALLAYKEFMRRFADESSESEEDDPDLYLDFKLGNDKKRLQIILNESEDEYPFPFNNPDELLEIFTTLEDANLFLIQRTQENEKILEDKQLDAKKNAEIANAELSKISERALELDER